MPVHVCPRGGRESGSNWHFLVVVPQPISYRFLKKRMNRSAWFIFPRFIHHSLVRHFLAKCSFHSSVHSLQLCWGSGRLTKMEPICQW